MLTRQTRKTMEDIKTASTIPRSHVIRLLEALDFKAKQTGSHQVWRHQKGYRVILINGKDPALQGYQLKSVRILLEEIEKKENTTMALDRTIVKSPGDTKDFYDKAALGQAALPNLSKLDLTGYNQQNAFKALSDSHNQVISYLQRLGSMLQSTQDYLIEMGVKLDEKQFQKAEKVKRTPEEIKQLRQEQVKAMREKSLVSKRAKAIAAIKKAEKDYPHIAHSPKKLSVLAGVAIQTLKKYKAEGLV